jgi:starvation-inducible DNA-binding protein
MLSDDLKTLLATDYAYVIKAQFFHWNVEGADFIQLHSFFGDIYEDAYSAIDSIAEYIRTLDSNPPGSFSRFSELSLITDQTQIPRSRIMIEELMADNQTMIDLLYQCFHSANDEDQQDIANFIAERISAHGKKAWMMKSILKDQRT